MAKTSLSLKISSKAVKPEKQVENSVLFWCLQNHWDVDVFDSKAIRSQFGRMIKNPGLPVGTPDIVGHSSDSLAVYIELKKNKGRGLCREAQYYFLRKKIESGAFAIVCDSPAHLSETYLQWKEFRSDPSCAAAYLISQLPKKFLSNGRVVLAPT